MEKKYRIDKFEMILDFLFLMLIMGLVIYISNSELSPGDRVIVISIWTFIALWSMHNWTWIKEVN